MTKSHSDFEPVRRWVRERERIRQRRAAGDPPPWSDDPIFNSNRFCNVRREDDTVTIWIRQNIRKPYRDHPFLWLMLCIARQINWPPTLEFLIRERAWPAAQVRFLDAMAKALEARQQSGEKVYTGAYVISASSEKGRRKSDYIAHEVIGGLWKRRESFRYLTDLRSTCALLEGTNGWGHFMAYQAVVDMRFTNLLDHAPDKDTWAAAGPGTLRGLNRIHGREVRAPLSQDQALDEMRALYESLGDIGISIDFSDVPNILCETDKYLRLLKGEGKVRSRYVPKPGGFY